MWPRGPAPPPAALAGTFPRTAGPSPVPASLWGTSSLCTCQGSVPTPPSPNKTRTRLVPASCPFTVRGACWLAPWVGQESPEVPEPVPSPRASAGADRRPPTLHSRPTFWPINVMVSKVLSSVSSLFSLYFRGILWLQIGKSAFVALTMKQCQQLPGNFSMGVLPVLHSQQVLLSTYYMLSILLGAGEQEEIIFKNPCFVISKPQTPFPDLPICHCFPKL